MSTVKRGFGSDNAATIHPRVLEAIAAINHGHAPGYGHDPYTEMVAQKLAGLCGPDAQAFFVFNGTGANVLNIRAACRPWHAVICAEAAHIAADEGGAPESLAGVKLIGLPTTDGKLSPEQIPPLLVHAGDEHAVQPRLLSVSQSTELGTLYTVEELRALAELAHAHDLLLHVDGARISNACAALETTPRELIGETGVDLLSFGGTKNGLLGGEAVVVLNPALADGILYLRKQSMQLASKMRFIAAQFDALLTDELWRELAAHANAMAARLAAGVLALGDARVQVTRPVAANAVFARLPRPAIAALQAETHFYTWDDAADEVRWMCAWDTTAEDVDTFLAAIAATLARLDA